MSTLHKQDNSGKQTKRLRRNGLPKDEVAARYEDGESAESIAIDYGCSTSTVLRSLRRWGYKTRTFGEHRRIFTDAIEAEILSDYNKGLTISRVSEKYKCSASAIMYAIRRQGGTQRSWEESNWIGAQNQRVLSTEQKEEIVFAYKLGKTAEVLSEEFGCSVSPIYSALKEFGVARRTNSESHRVYPLREDYFSIIDSEDKAWMLGFIAADGNVCNGRLQFRLSRKDIEVLERIRGLIGGPPIYDLGRIVGSMPRGGVSVTYPVHFAVASRQMTDDLRKLGIHPNKTHTVRPWTAPTFDLQRWYWKGVIDGDGTVARFRCGKWYVQLVGNKYMVDGFSEFVGKHIKTESSTKPMGTIWQVKFCGNRVAQGVAKILYEDSTFHLDRKKRSADQLIATRLLRKPYTKWDYSHISDAVIDDALSRSRSVLSAAKLLQMDGRALHYILKKRNT